MIHVLIHTPVTALKEIDMVINEESDIIPLDVYFDYL